MKNKDFILYVEKQARSLSYSLLSLNLSWKKKTLNSQIGLMKEIHENSIVEIKTFVNSVLKKFTKTLSIELSSLKC